MKGLRRRHGRARRQYAVVTESLAGEPTGGRGKWIQSRAEADRVAALYEHLARSAGRGAIVRVLDDSGREVARRRIG